MATFFKSVPVRLEDEDLSALRVACYLRARGYCERCGCQTWLAAAPEHPQKADMAHKKGREANGSDTLNNVENLCHRCYLLGHSGGKPCPKKERKQ
jgi:hypothetical protein